MRILFLLLVLLSASMLGAFLFCQGFGGIAACSALDERLFFDMASGSLHLGLFSIAMFFLWKKDLGSTLKGIGFPGDISDSLIYAVAGFGAIIALLFVFGIAATMLGFNDQQKITEKVVSLPVYLLVFAVVIAPVSEELFFRAMLVPRIGIIFSSLIFGLVHFTYGSVVELVGAAMVGLVLASIFRISKSITPCIIIHVTYNLVSVLVLRLFA